MSTSTSQTPIPVIKGISTVVTVQIADSDGNPITGKYAGTEAMSATAWPGDDQAQAFALSAAWNNGPLGLVDLTIPGTNTASQGDGIYQWLLQLADGSAALARGSIRLSGYPGSATSGSPDLTTLSYVQLALASVSLTPAQVDYLPFAVSTASELVRKFCRRKFTRKTFTLYQSPSLEGQILLDEIPVNSVLRISSSLDTALTITADPTVFQVAYVSFLTNSDYSDWSTPFAYTGIQLNSITNGVSSSSQFLFADYPTIQAFATAIDAVSGWDTTLNSPSYSSWPTSELYCQDAGQGALSGDGVLLQVFSKDIGGQVDHRTGMIYLGTGYQSSGFGPRWGPDWLAFDSPYPSSNNTNIVRVIYDAGFNSIPTPVQQSVAEVSKAILIRFQTDYSLKSESIGDYKYELRDIWESIPVSAKQTLSLYRITNA